jgi:hypothetical protein
MRVLLLLTALGLASPVAAATPASPPAPASAPPQASTLKDVKDDLRLLPRNMLYDGRRIQVRPGPTKPNPEGRPGPGVG